MISVARLLLVGVSVWAFTGLIAVFSCWGPGSSAPGISLSGGGVLRVLSNAVNAKSHLADPTDALLSSAHGLHALHEAGVLSDEDESSRLALQLVGEILLVSRRQAAGGSGSGSGSSGGVPAMPGAGRAEPRDSAPEASPSVNPKSSLRLKKLGKFAKKAAGDSTEDAPGAEAKGDVAPKDMLYTHQKCFIGGDEAETCTYDGVLCFDGLSPVVVTDHPIKDPDRINDFTHSCMDPRYYEAASLEDGGCSFFKAGERKSFDYTKQAHYPTGYPMSLRLRRWGPLNRNGLLFFREMDKTEIWGNQPENAWAPIEDIDEAFLPYLEEEGSEQAAAAAAARQENDTLVEVPEAHFLQGLSTLKVSRRTRVNNITINWLPSNLWISGIDGQWYTNPFHWWSKVGTLYDSRRNNVSSGPHPQDGYVQWVDPAQVGRVPSTSKAPRGSHSVSSYKIGSGWDLPSMDVIAYAGDGAAVLEARSGLGDWFETLLDIAAPKSSKHFFKDLLDQLSPTNMLCSRRGAIPGGKFKLFTGRADAALLRQKAYNRAGLTSMGVVPKPMYPPRKITIIDRKGMNGRGIYNFKEIVELVKATGLPYELVTTMAKLSFADQVQLMANTGIIIAPHGAALANIMFLPAHAAVVEMFPYLMKKNTYRYLSGILDLHYFPLYSWELLSSNHTEFYGVELMNEMYFYNNCVLTNITSFDALNEHACNAASKNYPIVVNMDLLKVALEDAIDTIGAFSHLNPAWIAEKEKQGAPNAKMPHWIAAPPDNLKGP